MRAVVALAGATLLAMAAGASAQGYPWVPQPSPPSAGATVLPPWMQDDGSSSDYPTHTATDWEADRLNSLYGDGMTFSEEGPAPYWEPR